MHVKPFVPSRIIFILPFSTTATAASLAILGGAAERAFAISESTVSLSDGVVCAMTAELRPSSAKRIVIEITMLKFRVRRILISQKAVYINGYGTWIRAIYP
jgi:hypothetical protein